MASKIEFEVNKSKSGVHFLDVAIEKTDKNTIKTSVYTKPTDAHLYLNASSCHPKHTIRNLPKGQFIRYKRICSDENDFLRQSAELKQFFLKRGFSEKLLSRTINEVKKMDRDSLLAENIEGSGENCLLILHCECDVTSICPALEVTWKSHFA